MQSTCLHADFGLLWFHTCNAYMRLDKPLNVCSRQLVPCPPKDIASPSCSVNSMHNWSSLSALVISKLEVGRQGPLCVLQIVHQSDKLVCMLGTERGSQTLHPVHLPLSLLPAGLNLFHRRLRLMMTLVIWTIPLLLMLLHQLVTLHSCYESTTRLARLERLRISGVRVSAS
jgi:hypothetical protein